MLSQIVHALFLVNVLCNIRADARIGQACGVFDLSALVKHLWGSSKL